MDKKALGHLKPFLVRIKEKFPKAKMLLFGSRARDDFRKDSDYDLLVVSPEFKPRRLVDRMVDIYQLQEEALNVEVICLTPKEFQERSKGPTMIAKIREQAVELEV